MLLFLDGMAHYDSSRIGLKYSSLSSATCLWSVTSEGRFGNCIKRVSTVGGGTQGYLGIAPLTTRLGVWTPTVSGVCGFAIKVDDLTRVATTNVDGSTTGLIEIWEGSLFHLQLLLNPDGTFTLIRNDGTVTGVIIPLAQSSEGLTSGTWLYVEMRWLLHATAGSVTVCVNGVAVLTYSGPTQENTVFSSLGVWNAVRLARVQATGATPNLTLRLCDLYLADLVTAAASDVSDFLGDGTITTIMPNGVGASTGWVPSGAATNWDATNDLPAPDDDATYVGTTGVGSQDTYQYQDIPAGALVKGVQVNILARKETEGSAAVAPVVHQGSTDYLGPTQGVASLNYDRYVTQTWDLNPATGVKFTAGEINAGQFGVKKVI